MLLTGKVEDVDMMEVYKFAPMCTIQVSRLLVTSGNGRKQAPIVRSQYTTVGSVGPVLRAAKRSWMSTVKLEPQVPMSTCPCDSKNTSRRTTMFVSTPCSLAVLARK